MTTVGVWTGREARLLREALRLSLRDFAAHLGVGQRTVSKWEAGGSELRPRPEMQAVLDTALAQAPDGAQARFRAAIRDGKPEKETSDAGRRTHDELSGSIVDVELEIDLDIAQDDSATVSYRYKILNLTERPITRIIRELWFEETCGPLSISALDSGDRHLVVHPIHDAKQLTKFACQISPPIEPGGVAEVRYLCKGGRFARRLYWRQSTARHTHHLAITLRHRGGRSLTACTATEEHPDGSENSAAEGLRWHYDGQDILVTLTRGHLRPGQAVTLRWEVERAPTR